MIGPSKILTVSYGTFSCTLEGFDEPFNTMKAIAEYFRDLAAGDRYFGAEPPIPDAAMLHKIAEREIHRRVEAKIQENGVILRTGDALAPAARIAAPAVAPAPASPAPAPENAPQTVAAPVVAAPPFSPAVPRVAPDSPAGLESVAQRLSRLRAAQIGGQIGGQIVEPARVEPARVEPAHVVAPLLAARFADAAMAEPDFADNDAYAEDQDVAFASPPAPEAEIVAPVAGPEPEILEPEIFNADLPEKTMAEETMAEEDLADLHGLDGVAADDLNLADPAEDFVTAEPEAEADLGVVIEDLDQLAADLAAGVDPDEILIALADQEPSFQAAPDSDPESDPQTPASLTEAVDQDEAVDQFVDEAPPAADWLDSESLSGEVIEDADQDFGFDGPETDDRHGFDLAADVPDAEVAEAEMAEAEMAESAADDLSDTILAALTGLTQRAAAPVEVRDPTLDDLDDDGFDLSGALKDSIAASLAEAEFAEPLDPGEAAAAAIAPAPEAETRAIVEIPAAPTMEAPAALAPEVGEKLQRARARVIKIRRADAPALIIGRGRAPALAPPIEAVALAPMLGDVLSPAAEAALQRDLAALELDARAEAALQAALDSDPAPEPVQAAPSTAFAAPQATAVAGVDAVDRLMAETNSHLEVPETKRRQSAIAHLKAAVAATIADRWSDPKEAATKAEARLDPYRKDLEQVVGPTHPGEVMDANRPAPLMLVSSQRIDRPKPAADIPAPRIVQPVRPRRVTSGGPALRPVSLVSDDDADEIAEAATERAENIFSADAAQSFAEFAERLGVSTMPDLLEAAAAYCALVLGREQFSRPLLLETVAGQPGAGDASPEDFLRGFGTLLRDGRITKVRRGQFQLAQDSHVLTEAKRFAG